MRRSTRRAGPRRAGARHRRRRTRASRRTCTAGTGSTRSRCTGRISHGPGRSRERDYGPRTRRRAWGATATAASSRARTVARGRARDRPLRDRLVRARTSASTGSPRSGTSARRRGQRRSGRTGTRPSGRARRGRARGARALGRPRERTRCGSATRCTARPCRCQCSMPPAANLSILKSPTALRLEDGTFYGWEGCHPAAGCCEGSCTHVWNYQQALPFLFPALERSMRDGGLRPQHRRRGRHELPPQPAARARSYRTERPCADGQFGDILKLYRDWKLSGDLDWLRGSGPQARRSLEYAWSPDNPDRWDPGADGRPVGSAAPHARHGAVRAQRWLTGFYLGALKAAAAMADALGEPSRGRGLRAIHERGRAWVSRPPVQRRVLRPAT